MSSDTGPFWERPDVVERFTSRDPDHRLVRIVEEYADPPTIRVLDVGCAGGRNTLLLAERGFDVVALDASAAMVARTRSRVAAVLGTEQAEERVRRGRMSDLSAFGDGRFDLVVALGVYHAAESVAEWELALSETARVLTPGGRALVNQFTPEVDLTGDGVSPVPDEPGVYDGLPGGRAVLVDAEALDEAMSRHGFVPVVPSETVRVDTERGRRVSVNAFYERRPHGRTVDQRHDP